MTSALQKMSKMPSLQDATVMLVEDHADACTTVQLMLKQMGITNIVVATDGASALKEFAKLNEKIDLILCDWNMPNMSGIEFLRQIRRVNARLPFIMITARGDRASIETAKAANVSGYILKPFSLEEMQKKITAFIRTDF